MDDNRLFRRVISEILLDHPAVEVVGTAENGRVALEKIAALAPDFITLDIEMPELDGLGVLRELTSRKLSTQAVVLSSHTSSGANTAIRALNLGAFEVIAKPAGTSALESRDMLSRALSSSVDALVQSTRGRHLGAEILPRIQRAEKIPARVSTTGPPSHSPVPPRPAENGTDRGSEAPLRSTAPIELILVGVSTGGPACLSSFLPMLPEDLSVPVAIVQHMPPVFTRSLAESLDRRSAIQVSEATPGARMQPGHAYIAPGGQQMKIRKSSEELIAVITDDPPERNCRPSVDVLFRSAAKALGPRCLAIVLTGMGDDGTEGCGALKEQGAAVFAQDEASCVVYGMPRSVVEAGYADLVASPEKIAQTILTRIKCSTSPQS